MISDAWVKDITYYTDNARTSGDAPGRMAYYVDAGGGEPPGVWCSPTNWQTEDKSVVMPFELQRLAKGCDAKSGKPLSDQLPKKRRAALDVCLTPPKDFSVLWALCGAADRARLEAILYQATREILDLVHKQGLIECRQGKGGTIRRPAKSFAAALYLHHSTREGDPNLHCHCVLPNIAERQDGSCGAINNEKLKENRILLDAIFKWKVGRALETNGISVAAHAEHGFIVADVPDDLRVSWSTRRQKIKAEAARQGFLTGDDAAAAQIVALQTRARKADIPPLPELDEKWTAEAAEHGIEPGVEWAHLDGPPIYRAPARQQGEMQAIMTEAIEGMAETRSFWDQRRLVAQTICAAIGRVDQLSYIDATLGTMKRSGELVQIAADEGQPILSTPQIISDEMRITEIVKSRSTEASRFSAAALAAAFDDDRLSTEQRDALRDALGVGGSIAIEGGAGVGKTTASAGIKRACEVDGKRLLLASPEWRAAGVLARELEIEEKFSVDRIINQHRAGNLKLGPDDVILIDEAGKLHRELALELLEIGATTGTKIVFVGDTRQMSSIKAGDPLAIIAKANPATQIRQIRRQKVAWMRGASMKAQAGVVDQALDDYAGHGHVTVGQTTDEAVSRIAAAFRASGGDAMAITATNRNVASINTALRDVARDLRIVTGADTVISAVPRGKNAKPGKLCIATGDGLIAGAQLNLGNGHIIENGTIFNNVLIDGDAITLITDDDRQFRTTAQQLKISGRNGSPPHLQHAFCLTTMSSQGGTWNQVLWFVTAEASKAAYVAMTRHRDNLLVYISRETVPLRAPDVTLRVSRTGLRDAEDPIDDRSDFDIIKIVGKSLSCPDELRNAVDAAAAYAAEIAPPVTQVVMDNADAMEDIPSCREEVPAS